MHGHRSKRVRSDAETNSHALQAWVRLILRAMMIMCHADQHRVQHHLCIPGPRGVLARQIVEMDGRAAQDDATRQGGQPTQPRITRTIPEGSGVQASNSYGVVAGEFNLSP